MAAEEFIYAIVVSQSDGDSFRAKPMPGDEGNIVWASLANRLDEDGDIPFRIAHIDAPEIGQPKGREARDEIGVLYGPGDRVKIHAAIKEDRYRRVIAEVRTDYGIDVAHAMVRTGNAWWAGHHDAAYSKRLELEEAQDKAMADQIGIWAGEKPLPPWEWRRR